MKYLEARFSQFEVVAGRADRNPAAVTEAGPCLAFSIHWLRLALSHRRVKHCDIYAGLTSGCLGVISPVDVAGPS